MPASVPAVTDPIIGRRSKLMDVELLSLENIVAGGAPFQAPSSLARHSWDSSVKNA